MGEEDEMVCPACGSSNFFHEIRTYEDFTISRDKDGDIDYDDYDSSCYDQEVMSGMSCGECMMSLEESELISIEDYERKSKAKTLVKELT